MFISNAFAQGAGGEPSIITSIAPLLIVFAIFYFIVIAPQRKRQKTHEARVNALTRNDKIVTAGGMYATVKRVIDHRLEIVLEGSNTVAIINKSSVTLILDEEVAPVSKNEAKPKATPAKKTAKKPAAKKPAAKKAITKSK